MKRAVVLILLVLIWSGHANAAFISGSTGADGAFSPTANVTVQVPASGIFNYTTVTIPAGVTVTYTPNAANTPVYMLATGNVIINGTISIAGGLANNTTQSGQGGPGGYNGGTGGSTGLPGGNGLGPGGGQGGIDTNHYHGGGGGYGTAGSAYSTSDGTGGTTYGNAALVVPLIGGSGGGGSAGNTAYGGATYGYGGGGGGGVILIASSGTITISGSVIADGGLAYNGMDYNNYHYCSTYNGYNFAGAGSGGAIKIQANTITGSGYISAQGGCGTSPIAGGAGYIRLEAYSNSFAAGTNPPYTYGQPTSAFVSNSPSLSITSVGGIAVTNAMGSYAQPDVILPSSTTNPVPIGLSALNIPVGTTINVTVVPQYGANSSVTTILTGTNNSSSGNVNVTLSTLYANVIEAEATFSLQVSMYWNGEKIDKVKVASRVGGKSEATYITDSGKTIREEQLLLAGLLRK
jgi:hypothetical protein